MLPGKHRLNLHAIYLESGHFYPTEVISDKLSAVLLYLDKMLLHVSRGVRWDSDHVVILSDELHAIAEDLVRGGFLDRVHIGLDFSMRVLTARPRLDQRGESLRARGAQQTNSLGKGNIDNGIFFLRKRKDPQRHISTLFYRRRYPSVWA